MFDLVTLLELRRAAHLCQIIKTSFSRSNPVPRGQATVIRSFIRQRKNVEQRTIQSDKLPSYIQSFTTLWSARPSCRSPGKVSDATRSPSQHLEASRSIFSSQCTRTDNAHQTAVNFYFLQKTISNAQTPSRPPNRCDSTTRSALAEGVAKGDNSP